ncbi:MAG: hypothetical protein JWM99_717 [Verrucomicrobiales bacterium]|nr:hypothetical protein [Verrucomicrobiales bacterium]
MRIVVYTNWLVAAYFIKRNQSRSEIVSRFAERCDIPWTVPAPALLEARSVFAAYAGKANGPEWEKLKADMGLKLLQLPFSWDEIVRKAEELSDRFATKARVGTFDLLILATALKVEATHLLSFDTNSSLRALGAVLQFKVFPELTTEDKQRVAALR